MEKRESLLKLCCCFALGICFSVDAIHAEISLNSLFADHMVIQRETDVPIWGWGDPNEAVTISTSWGAKTQTVTKSDGTWKTKIRTPEAGGPYTITISGENTIVINDVLSGEVWLCTGQSNMDFEMNKFVNDSRDSMHQPLVDYIRNEIATADDKMIRHIEVPQTPSLYEQKFDFEDEWRCADSSGINEISATGYFFAKELRAHLNVPIGLVECSWGGTRIQPWLSEEAYRSDKNLEEYFDATRSEIKKTIELMDAEGYVDTAYEQSMEKWKNAGKKGRKPRPATHPREDRQLPATDYNGMLSAVIPYAIRGAIWYQGESNAVYLPEEQEIYLTKMIETWRSDWGQGDFSFYWAQLAACNRANDEAANGWAVVNDKMRRTMKLPNTGMAVLYDIGEPKDIHPNNKMDAGKRLSLWALKYDYGLDLNVVSGPLYVQMEIKNNKIEIEFNSVGEGLMIGHKNLLDPVKEVDEPLKWFEIQDKDGLWHSADARVIGKNKIEVYNTTVSEPMNVRYAWTGNPEGANLYNREGLPASVFTTED